MPSVKLLLWRHRYDLALLATGLLLLETFNLLLQLDRQTFLYPDAGNYLESSRDLFRHVRLHEYRPMLMAFVNGLPYLVAVDGDEVVGFAYAAPFRPRPAYKYGVENSIYLAPGQTGKGIGKALLNELIVLCTARGLYAMIAVIGDRDNQASIGVHRACGFVETGALPRVGFKFGRWLDVVFMMRDLLPATDSPQGDGWAG